MSHLKEGVAALGLDEKGATNYLMGALASAVASGMNTEYRLNNVIELLRDFNDLFPSQVIAAELAKLTPPGTAEGDYPPL